MRPRIGLLIVSLVPLLTGCAMLRTTLDGWRTGADGLSPSQRTLRRALQAGNFAAALGEREDDAMLRVLTRGATTYYAAQYERSAALLDTAALLADARLTTSVSRGALSFVTNDLARLYAPRRTERLFVPYYGMLSYARLGRWEDAAVEARRMASLLAQYKAAQEDGERALHASMHHLAGAVFERAGEHDDAGVSYRNANALVASFPAYATPRDRAVESEILVIVERGFVAHRTTETIRVEFARDDRDSLRASDDSRRRLVDRLGARFAERDVRDRTPGAIRTQFHQRADQAKAHTPAPPRERGARHEHDDDDDDELGDLRLAFPALRRSPRPWGGAPRVLADSTAPTPDSTFVRVAASVDDASAVDERRERAAIVTRELARAAAKYAMAKTVRDKTGKVRGVVADIASTLLERADVRSWHLLPQEVVLMRVRLPAGQHRLRVVVGDGAGQREVDLGPVTLAPGTLTILPARIWAEPTPSHTGRTDPCTLTVLTCVN